MSNIKKLMSSAAGGGEVLNVEDVFSTYLYDGTGSLGYNKPITNGIALGDFGTGSSTKFGGETGDYLGRTTEFTGNSDSTTFTFSGWIYRENSDSNMYLYSTDNGTYHFNINVNNSNNMIVSGWRNTSSRSLYTQSSGLNVPWGWSHILISIDLSSTAKRHIYINDVDQSSKFNWSTYTNDPIKFTWGKHTVGAFPLNGGEVDGNLAHVYLDYTYRDLSNVANRRIFIDANGGSTSPSSLAALNPIMYIPCTEDYPLGKNLGTGGDLSVNGDVRIDSSNGTVYESGYGQGGLVWIKNREYGYSHTLSDTENGTGLQLNTDATSVQSSSQRIVRFNANGFSIGTDNAVNYSPSNIASWTFRKAPKFFDVVTYTGNGSTSQTISHNLGSAPGMMIIKCLNNNYSWAVYHREMYEIGHYSGSTDPTDFYMLLNSTGKVGYTTGSGFWGNTQPTATEFTVGENALVNVSGGEFVAYLFAHNDGDGEFGPTGDQDIIKCGSYIGNGSTNGPEIDLGFEPQWLLIKNTSDNGPDWLMCDTMRGIHWTIPSWTNLETRTLRANSTSSEADNGVDIQLKPNGFKLVDTSSSNSSGDKFIYMAIRRPTGIPLDGTEVFHANKFTTTGFTEYTGVGFAPDLVMQKASANGDNVDLVDKLRGPYAFFRPNNSDQEDNNTQYYLSGFLNDGVKMGSASNGQFNGWNPNTHWYLKRAPGFFDQVAFISSNTPSATNSRVEHGLGVTPEMIWFKPRFYSYNWWVYHKDLGDSTSSPTRDIDFRIQLNSNAARTQTVSVWGTSPPTETDFGYNYNDLVYRQVGVTAYLFASLDGVSKVGSYTGTSATQTIDCGFSTGARFVMIKEVSGSGEWLVFDYARGITATSNDGVFHFSSTNGEFIEANFGYDMIRPHNSGFTLDASANAVNYNGNKFIFYAIA